MRPSSCIRHGLLAALLLGACSTSDLAPSGSGGSGADGGAGGPALPTGQALTTAAVVRYSPIEGGCWSLEVEGRGHYQPLSLPPAYQQDGAAVAVVIRGAQGYAGFCPHPFVHLDSIAPR